MAPAAEPLRDMPELGGKISVNKENVHGTSLQGRHRISCMPGILAGSLYLTSHLELRKNFFLWVGKRYIRTVECDIG
jgi:hypothetical protein